MVCLLVSSMLLEFYVYVPKGKRPYARRILSTVVWLRPSMSSEDGGVSVDGRGVEGSVKIFLLRDGGWRRRI